MNFELIDNFFQVIVLAVSAVVSAVYALRRQDARFVMLGLAYASFSMGTLYWVLYITIMGDLPYGCYIPELSWGASYFFYLSLQIYRGQGKKKPFSLIGILGALALAIVIVELRIFVPYLLVSALYALIVGSIYYLSAVHSRYGTALDTAMMFCTVWQQVLYLSSAFFTDYTRFNLYFAIDIVLTLSFVSLLPILVREVDA